MFDGSQLRVLIAEDNDTDYLLLHRQLKKILNPGVCLRVERRTGLLEALTGRWDLIVTDYHLLDIEGDDLLGVIAEAQPDTPCVVMSGSLHGLLEACVPDNVFAKIEKGDHDSLRTILTSRWG